MLFFPARWWNYYYYYYYFWCWCYSFFSFLDYIISCFLFLDTVHALRLLTIQPLDFYLRDK